MNKMTEDHEFTLAEELHKLKARSATAMAIIQGEETFTVMTSGCGYAEREENPGEKYFFIHLNGMDFVFDDEDPQHRDMLVQISEHLARHAAALTAAP